MAEERKPVTRRAYLADMAATGAVLLGSAVWGLGMRDADGRSQPPRENDRPAMAGSPSPPRELDRPVMTGSPAPPPPPREHDSVRTAGAVAPPPPKEAEHVMAPGRMAVPRPQPTPTCGNSVPRRK